MSNIIKFYTFFKKLNLKFNFKLLKHDDDDDDVCFEVIWVL
jgi:hypothetical protein